MTRTEELWEREEVLLREEHTNWLSSAKWSALKTHTSNIIWPQKVIFGNIYHIYKYIYAFNNNSKNKVAMNLKGSREGLEGEML